MYNIQWNDKLKTKNSFTENLVSFSFDDGFHRGRTDICLLVLNKTPIRRSLGLQALIVEKHIA